MAYLLQHTTMEWDTAAGIAAVILAVCLVVLIVTHIVRRRRISALEEELSAHYDYDEPDKTAAPAADTAGTESGPATGGSV